MEAIQFINITPQELATLIDQKFKEQIDDLKKNFQPKEPEEILTRTEVSKMLKISLVTLHDWVNKDILKPYKMGNKTFFRRSEITETMLSSNRR